MLKILTGADVVHVPYRGEAPALTDLIAGQMHAQFVTMTSATPLAKQGQLRPLAVSMRSRSKSLPEIPALGEVVPGYEMDGIAGLAGPRNVPADIVAKINNEIRASLARPMIQAKYDELGLEVFSAPASEFGSLITREVEKYKGIGKAAGIKLE